MFVLEILGYILLVIAATIASSAGYFMVRAEQVNQGKILSIMFLFGALGGIFLYVSKVFGE